MLGTKRQTSKLADDKRVAKPKRHDTSEDKKKCINKQKICEKIQRNLWNLQAQCQHVNKYNRTKEGYSVGLIKAIKTTPPKISVTKDENGEILTQKEEVIRRRAAYYEKPYCDNLSTVSKCATRVRELEENRQHHKSHPRTMCWGMRLLHQWKVEEQQRSRIDGIIERSDSKWWRCSVRSNQRPNTEDGLSSETVTRWMGQGEYWLHSKET